MELGETSLPVGVVGEIAEVPTLDVGNDPASDRVPFSLATAASTSTLSVSARPWDTE